MTCSGSATPIPTLLFKYGGSCNYLESDTFSYKAVYQTAVDKPVVDYCATFDPLLTQGTSGYMKLRIATDGSYASYETFLDMTLFNTSLKSTQCDITKGLKYHVWIINS